MNKQIINLLTVGLTLLLTACGGSGNKGQAPELAEQSKLGTVHTLTPEYSFTSTLAGTINYAGACASETTQAKAGENTITFNNLEWWGEYDNCEITVTSDKGKISPILKITPFEVIPKPTEINKLGEVFTLTPEYTFHTDIAGELSYEGSCIADTKNVKAGENTITFNNLEWWESYSDCEITVTSDNGKKLPALKITPFNVIPKPTEVEEIGEVFELKAEYRFKTDFAGTITYQGRCSSDTTQATVGENVVELKLSKWWITYDDCALTITTDDGKTTSQLSISPFRTVYPAKHPLSDTGMTRCANFPRYADGSFPGPDYNGNFDEFKVGLNCDDFGVTQTEDGWDGEFVIPAGQDATHGRDALAAQGKLEKVGHGHGGYDFTKLDKDGNELDYSAEEYACIRDNYTGLIWEVKTNGHWRSDLHSGDATYLWYTPNGNNGGLPGLSDNNTNQQRCANKGRCDTDKFIKDVNLDNYCGLSNWRLPTYSEIASIANVQSADDQMDHYVENPILRYANSFNFTSDFIKKDSYRHIISSFNLTLYFPAFVLPENWESPDAMLGVVLVSEPVDYQKPLSTDEKYEALTEATVLDKNTGLIWTHCPATMVDDNDICTKTYSWNEALAAVQTANNNGFLGYNDWRLPSIYELTSLQAFDRIPMINQDVFSIDDIENKSFWSSTPSIRNTPSSAGIKIIHFDFYLEDIRSSKLNKKHHVLLVRGGY